MKIALSQRTYDMLVNASVFTAIASAILYDHVPQFGALFVLIGLIAASVAATSYFLLHSFEDRPETSSAGDVVIQINPQPDTATLISDVPALPTVTSGVMDSYRRVYAAWGVTILGDPVTEMLNLQLARQEAMLKKMTSDVVQKQMAVVKEELRRELLNGPWKDIARIRERSLPARRRIHPIKRTSDVVSIGPKGDWYH